MISIRGRVLLLLKDGEDVRLFFDRCGFTSYGYFLSMLRYFERQGLIIREKVSSSHTIVRFRDKGKRVREALGVLA